MVNRLTSQNLGPETAEDFAKLLVTPPHGWCWCVAWETPTWDGWTDRSEAENRCLRRQLSDEGFYHGQIFYLDETAIAWVRVGPRAAWPKLCSTFNLDPSEPVYAFTCFGIAGTHRGQGLMHEAMQLSLATLAEEGVRQVEGFPRRSSLTERLDPGEVWMGPARLFTKAGFEITETRENSLCMRLQLPV